MNRLWYKKTAKDWNNALPLGNGFMGAMCFGGTLIDRFQLNNDSIWWSGPRDRINPDAKLFPQNNEKRLKIYVTSSDVFI